MYHPKMVEFEARLKALFDEVDHYIEEQYGQLYPLHPSRPQRGQTENPQADGLFNIGADFTPGFGSERGRGYIIDVTMVTLSDIEEQVREEILQKTAARVRELLPRYFPERKLDVFRDGTHFKIQGDFGLGYL